ncbi:cAMP phosphodiesterase class-II:metallo-beta-lactamase superfamily protein [Betaproteobacteria bacterium]|nr:cAMP phosphodiesterase class-II:metallo-beta-lactamase superfamily protein [Betaproteobacteria bacterium]GHU03943.1 cAMP phosphodiesterase class-II:metallo-beta-lactamase superfamily protein [Betaproteobacteria bacterium]GHU13812.1 cAMP phosphodiesterase class-II:metallo-beta-lactamase superfamily protein [Betaproteobacteria bacterium]
MKLTVLGCSGGIGGENARTSSFLVDRDVLLDCGTGVGDLDFESLRAISHIFLSHSHLDHVAALPLLVDAIGEIRHHTMTVYATAETIHILRAHLFNWLLWPDFTAIPDRRHPYLRLQVVKVGESVRLGKRVITALPAQHTVPAVGWCVDSGEAQLVYTGDTTYCPELIAALNRLPALAHLIVETAFPEEMRGLAVASRHLCPGMLANMLNELTVSPEVYISHLKSGLGGKIMEQIDAIDSRFRPTRLHQGMALNF